MSKPKNSKSSWKTATVEFSRPFQIIDGFPSGFQWGIPSEEAGIFIEKFEVQNAEVSPITLAQRRLEELAASLKLVAWRHNSFSQSAERIHRQTTDLVCAICKLR